VALALEFQGTGDIGDALAAVVATVEAGVGAAPDLLDLLVAVDLDAVEINRDAGGLGANAVFDSGTGAASGRA